MDELVRLIEVSCLMHGHKSMTKRLLHLIFMYTQQNFSGFKIHNIFKAGSLGHGTAVFGDFDVDLVIYSDSKCVYKCFIVV